MNDQRPGPSDAAETPDEDAGQVSQGPSGSLGAEQLGGADAVPDTPDKNFPEEPDRRDPDRRGTTLPAE